MDAATNGAATTTSLPSLYEMELLKETRELELEAKLDALERLQEQQQHAYEVQQLKHIQSQTAANQGLYPYGLEK